MYPQGLRNYMEKKVENNDEEYFARPNNARELILNEHLMPFFMSYLKAMTNESIDLVLHPLCARFLDTHDCSAEDLSTLDDDKLMEFKSIFRANKSKSHEGCSQ
jgi:hypothetical protein